MPAYLRGVQRFFPRKAAGVKPHSLLFQDVLASRSFAKGLGAKVSPARHWRKDCPPTLVMVGTGEPPFAGGHVSSLNEKFLADTLPRMGAFLKSIGFLDGVPARRDKLPKLQRFLGATDTCAPPLRQEGQRGQ